MFPMIEPKDEIKDAVARAFALCDKFERGQIVPYDHLEVALKCYRDSNDWKTRVTKFRREYLNATGKAFRPVQNVGYEILTEADQNVWLPRHRQKKSCRQLTRAIKEVSVSSTATLSVEERKIRALMLDNLAHERKVMRACMREQSAEIRTPTCLCPRPKDLSPS